MINNPILKNEDKYKYNILKMAQGIDLGQYKFKLGNDRLYWISPFDNGWVNTEDGRVYFKSKKFESFLYTQQNRSVNELIVDNIAKQLGIPVAKYEPAHLDKTEAIISHDVAKDYEEVLLLDWLFDIGKYNNNLEYIITHWDDSCMKNYKVNKEEIVFGLYKMLVLDTLTMQEDRHQANIFFIRDTRDNSLRLAPLVDNEFAFALKTLDQFIKISKSNQIDDYDMEKFVRVHSGKIRFTPLVASSAEKYKQYPKTVSELIQMAYNKPHYKQFLINSLKNINAEKAIMQVEKMGYEISPEYKKYICDTVDCAKQIFAEKIAEAKQTHPKMFEDNNEYEHC